jgi:hypothetical protein
MWLSSQSHVEITILAPGVSQIAFLPPPKSRSFTMEVSPEFIIIALVKLHPTLEPKPNEQSHEK